MSRLLVIRCDLCGKDVEWYPEGKALKGASGMPRCKQVKVDLGVCEGQFTLEPPTAPTLEKATRDVCIGCFTNDVAPLLAKLTEVMKTSYKGDIRESQK